MRMFTRAVGMHATSTARGPPRPFNISRRAEHTEATTANVDDDVSSGAQRASPQVSRDWGHLPGASIRYPHDGGGRSAAEAEPPR
jgi:hypothetical protein